MKTIREIFARALPPNQEKQVLQAFFIITKTFALGTGLKTVDEIVEYRQKVEPITGLTRQILLGRAITDLSLPDGRIMVIFQKRGKASLALFFENHIETDKGQRAMVGVNLNLQTQIQFNGGSNFGVTVEDGYSVVDALVQAVAALDRLDKNGETDLILKRNENPEVLNKR